MDSLYSRYANALFSIALEENKIDDYRNEIKMLKKIINENNDLLHLFSSYFIEEKDKNEIIDQTFKSLSQNTINFIKVIVHNRRANVMIKIFDEFIKNCNESLNVKDGIVYSVNPLDQNQMLKIENAISVKLNSKVELVNVIDEKLIGGVKVQVEDKIFDGSIKNRLENLKNTLISGGN